jgi:hypothetical protein
MTIESSGALGLNGTCTGGSSARNQIGAEVSKTAGTALCMNNSCLRTLSGTSSGAQISFNSFYGKSNTYTYTVSSNQTNFCMRAGAVSAGWNGTSKLSVVINSGVYISSNSTSTPAMTISGSYPNGVTVTNSGTIAGMGGNGGRGGCYGCVGSSGASGGTALKVSSAVTFNNTSGTIAGGGGGGGGGSGAYANFSCNIYTVGGGGGGGGRTGLSNSSGGAGGTGYNPPSTSGGAGGAGTYSSAGSGGTGAGMGFCGGGTINGGNGGSGGTWGASGASGSCATAGSGAAPGTGGGGGKATCGAGTYITWSGTGTRYGSIS